MTRTARKLLAAAALSTLAAPGVAAANPTAGAAGAAMTTRAMDPPDGCMLRLWDPAARHFWYTGNGKSLNGTGSCKTLQDHLTASAGAAKAPVAAPVKYVARAQWKEHVQRILRQPVVPIAAVK